MPRRPRRWRPDPFDVLEHHQREYPREITNWSPPGRTEQRVLDDWLRTQSGGTPVQIEDGKYYVVYKDVPDIGDYQPRPRYMVWFKGTDPSHVSELAEDLSAFYGMRQSEWDDLLREMHQRYGFEDPDTVTYGGFSRGGGLARMMGGKGYGSFMPDGYQPRDGSMEMDMPTDWFHDNVVPAMNAVSPLVSELEDDVLDQLYDSLPFLHRPHEDPDPFDEPAPKRPVPERSEPAAPKSSRDYSGFAPSFVGFPAKIKYDRKRNMHSVKNHFGLKRKAREWQPSHLDSAYRRHEIPDK